MRKKIFSLSLALLVAIVLCLPTPSHAVSTRAGIDYEAKWDELYSPLPMSPSVANDCTDTNPDEYYFEETFLDAVEQTLYTVIAPCKVYLDEEFIMMIAVEDPWCAGNDFWPTEVADAWSLKDTPDGDSTVTRDSGSYWSNTLALGSTGYYNEFYQVTYTGSAVNHTIAFAVDDLGFCAGFHSTSGSSIGGIVVDPVRGGSTNNAPEVDAGIDIVIASEDQNLTEVIGTATDADGDALFYTWYEDATEIQSEQAVGVDDSAPLYLSAVPALSVGAHTLTLSVTDGTDTTTSSVVVSVENTAPTVAASGAGTYAIGSDIAISGTVADFDGDSLTYTWSSYGAPFDTGVIATIYGGTPVDGADFVIVGGLTLGSHQLELSVTDGLHTTNATIVVEVTDSEAPTLAPTASTNILWPPRGDMVPVTITANASDNSGETVTIDVTITSNATPDDPTDYEVVSIDQTAGTASIALRAEKGHERIRVITPKGKERYRRLDRVYTVTVTATDSSGNSSSSDLLIKVAHDKKDKRNR